MLAITNLQYRVKMRILQVYILYSISTWSQCSIHKRYICLVIPKNNLVRKLHFWLNYIILFRWLLVALKSWLHQSCKIKQCVLYHHMESVAVTTSILLWRSSVNLNASQYFATCHKDWRHCISTKYVNRSILTSIIVFLTSVLMVVGTVCAGIAFSIALIVSDYNKMKKTTHKSSKSDLLSIETKH